MVFVLLAVWIIGAAITLKAGAAIANQPTDYHDWWLALMFWWLIAIQICASKHAVYTERPYKNLTFHY